jgi:hypothetical protein
MTLGLAPLLKIGLGPIIVKELFGWPTSWATEKLPLKLIKATNKIVKNRLFFMLIHQGNFFVSLIFERN